jgi:pilus assembly protein CpaB
MERKGNEREPSQVNVITLEVDPVEAEKLALASSQGELRLALRNFRDANRVATPGATIPSLLASDRLQERLRTGPTAKRRTVEVIKGGQVETRTWE